MPGYQHDKAGIAESVIAVVLLIGLAWSGASPLFGVEERSLFHQGGDASARPWRPKSDWRETNRLTRRGSS